MTLFSRAFTGVAVTFSSELQPRAAIVKVAELKRWTPGKPTFVGDVSEHAISLGIVPAGGLIVVRDSTRFEGAIVPSPSGCAIQGRFVSMVFARAFSALFLGVICVMAVVGVAGIVGGKIDSGMSVGFQALLSVGWISALALFGCGVLWNATPSHRAMEVMTKHLQLALTTGER